MKRSDLKYGALAGLCVLLTIPILGYVQKQAATMPRPPSDDRPSLRRERHQWQREALRGWLAHNTDTLSVVTSESNRRVMEVTLRPGETPAQVLTQARNVRQVMSSYFREGSDGAVTAVILHANRDQGAVSIRTGLADTATQRDSSWHITVGSKTIE